MKIEVKNASDETRKIWLFIFMFFLAIFVYTAQRGISWQDNGQYQWRCINGQILDPGEGLCRSHSLYMLIGWAISKLPFSYPASLNIFSGLMGAIAVANFTVLARFFTKNNILILAITFCLGLSHTLWWLSTITETYTTHLVIFSFELIFLLNYISTKRARYLYLLALANGVGISVHNMAMLSIPLYAIVVLAEIFKKNLRLGNLIISGLLWIIGLAPLITVSAIKMNYEPMGFVQLMKDIFVGRYGDDVFNVAGASKYAMANAFFASLNFQSLLPLAILLGFVGLIRNIKKISAAEKAIIGLTILHFVFFIRYSVPDQFMFILPSMFLMCLCAHKCLDAFTIKKTLKEKFIILILVFAVIQPLTFSGIYKATKMSGFAQRERTADKRDEARYWIMPWKNDENSAETWAWSIMDLLPGQTVIIADSTTAYPLYFANMFSKKNVLVLQGKPAEYGEKAYYSLSENIATPEGKSWTLLSEKPKLYRLE